MVAALRFAIPLPERLPLRWVIAFGGALFLAQLLAGTSVVFAELVFLFVVLSGVAINLAGGLSRLGGMCVAVMSLKLVIISQAAKALFGEPGDSRLEMPLTTIGVLLTGLASMTVAVVLAQWLRPGRHLFHADTTPENLRLAAIITFLLGAVSHLGVMSTGTDNGALMVGGAPGLLRQLAFCLSLAIVFSTAYVIQRSAGRQLFGWFNVLPALLYFLLGVLSASKQGMVEPFLLVFLTAVAFRFRFSVFHLAGSAVFFVIAVGALFPFGQVARGYTRGYGFSETISATAEFAGKHLGSVEGFRQLHQQNDDAEELADLTRYYEHSFGLLERVSLIKMADLLVVATVHDGESGWETITHGFKMVLPRFLYPNKPAVNTGSYLGRKAGVISEEDFGTQISFGFIADAFSAFGWAGAALIPGVVTFFFLVLFNWFVGSLERNVWCVYFFADFQHFFAEQTISGMTLTLLRRPIWLLAVYVLIRVSCLLWRLWRAPLKQSESVDMGRGRESILGRALPIGPGR